MPKEIQTYRDFWPYYLHEHRKPSTRALHYIGTSLVFVVLIIAIWSGVWWLLLLMPVAGYLFAWIGHFFVENNRPATFTYPAWSLVSDFRMYFLWLTGRLGRDLDRHQVR